MTCGRPIVRIGYPFTHCLRIRPTKSVWNDLMSSRMVYGELISCIVSVCALRSALKSNRQLLMHSNGVPILIPNTAPNTLSHVRVHILCGAHNVIWLNEWLFSSLFLFNIFPFSGMITIVSLSLPLCLSVSRGLSFLGNIRRRLFGGGQQRWETIFNIFRNTSAALGIQNAFVSEFLFGHSILLICLSGNSPAVRWAGVRTRPSTQSPLRSPPLVFCLSICNTKLFSHSIYLRRRRRRRWCVVSHSQVCTVHFFPVRRNSPFLLCPLHS